MLYIVIGLLVFLLVLQYTLFNQQITGLKKIVVELGKGNLNRRFRLQSVNPKINQLTVELNQWTDQVQDKMIHLNDLENEYRGILSHLSHDLRTPLTSLLGYTEVLKESSELSQEEREAYLAIIHEKAIKIQNLISRFFELAHLESSEEVLCVKGFNVIDVIHEVMLSFYQTIEKEGITPKIHLPDEAVMVQGNRDATERILLNLITNSIRYGNAGGVLGIGLRKETDHVWVDVWDRGQGISSKDLPHIFKRLYTGNPSRNMYTQGTGLGLTIAKKLVEKQGGEIRVESFPRKKTTFSFSIPRM